MHHCTTAVVGGGNERLVANVSASTVDSGFVTIPGGQMLLVSAPDVVDRCAAESYDGHLHGFDAHVAIVIEVTTGASCSG